MIQAGWQKYRLEAYELQEPVISGVKRVLN